MPYNAFISYCHVADSAVASALQSALHRFAKPWYKLRSLHVFRDQTNLAVNPGLWSSIREALDESLFFILLASPEAAASPWVAKEAEYWISRNGTSHILIVLTGGNLGWDGSHFCYAPDRTSALPPSLLKAFSEEPLFLDLGWSRGPSARLRLREPRFHEAVLQLSATIRNRPKDELDGADIRNQRQTRLLATSVLIVIFAIALFALRQTHQIRQEAVQDLAATIATRSAAIFTDNPDRIREAALLAIESDRLNPSFEANQALREAVSLLPAGAQVYPADDGDPEQRIRDMAFSPNGAVLSVVRDNGSTQLLDLSNHKPLGYFAADDSPAASIQAGSDPKDGSLSGDNADNAVTVAFNFSGGLVASGARNGLVHVWAYPGGREVLRIFHGSPVSKLAFHPATNQLVTATDDGHLRIIDIPNAKIVADLKVAGKIISTSFSPQGDRLAALSSDGPLFIFDPVHRKLLHQLFGGGDAAFNLVFSNDGKRVATAMGSFAFVWDVTTGQQLLKATHAASSDTLNVQQWIDDAAISPDGKFLAYATRSDVSAHVWNVKTGRQVLELKHDSRVAAVSFSADGTKLATGSYDGTARVWELPSGRELQRSPHAGGSEVVAFSPVGNRLASGGTDGSVVVSAMRRADRPAAFDMSGEVRAVAFSPDGRRFAIGTTSAHWSPLVRIADTSGNVVRDIEFHGPPVIEKLVFVDPNQVIAQWAESLFLINIDHGSVTPLPPFPSDFQIDPAGKLLATQQNEVNQLYTLPDLKQSASVTGPPSDLLRIAGQGRLLAFETRNPPNQFYVDIWSVAKKARVSRVSLPAELSKVALNSPGTMLLTAEGENMQVWDIPSGKRRLSFAAGGDIRLIVPDPSSASFATSGGHLTVWDAATGARLAQLPDTNAAAFSPDGRYLLAAYGGHSAALWLWRATDLQDEACARIASNLSHDEWQRSFPKYPYHVTCPNLPAGK